MKKPYLFLSVLFLFFLSQPVKAEPPEVNIDEDSKYVKSELHTKKQGDIKLKFTSSYYSNASSERNCKLYNYKNESDCSVPYININMELILPHKLYTDLKAYEGYSLRNQVDNNTYVYGKNFEIKPKFISFSSDLITHGCFDTGIFVDDVLYSIDEFVALSNGTSIQYERNKRINDCLLLSKSNEDLGKYSENISIELSLDDLRKLLVSNHIEVKVFEDVYVFPWQVVRDLKLFYDAAEKASKSNYVVNIPSYIATSKLDKKI